MKIVAFTGARSDWGLLAPVLTALRASPQVVLELCVTGQHLVDDSGSLSAIARDGFTPDYRVDMALGDEDGAARLAQSMAACLAGTGRVLEQAGADLCLVLGDRYEMLAVASAALLARVPVAHLCGGDVTRGAFDDAIRHSITKLSVLHFVTSEEARCRVVQLGEDPARVFACGSPGIDRIRQQPTLERQAFLARVGLDPGDAFFLVSLHPETLSSDRHALLDTLLQSLARFPDTALLLSGSNADPGGLRIDAAFQSLAAERDNAVFHRSLGSELYLSAMKHARLIIGNSSSGLYEAPSFRLPTVNVGGRQTGRSRADSVVDCEVGRASITRAIDQALRLELADVVNPYGDGHAAARIVDTLLSIGNPHDLLLKTFRDSRS